MKTKLKRTLSVFLCLMMLISVCPLIGLPQADAATNTWDGTIDTSFAGGGTASNPYQITSGAELAGVASLTNNNNGWSTGKYFVLTTDIDLNNREWTPIGIQYTTSGTTYNQGTRWFNGYFDGNGHVIKNLKIGTSSSRTKIKHAGLFGITDSSAVIVNLGLNNVSIYTQQLHADDRRGAFVGLAFGVIEGCYVKNATVNCSGTCVVGGFVGQVADNCTIYKCYGIM